MSELFPPLDYETAVKAHVYWIAEDDDVCYSMRGKEGAAMRSAMATQRITWRMVNESKANMIGFASRD